MIVGSEQELAELKQQVALQREKSDKAISALGANGTSALRTSALIGTQGPDEASCKVLNSSLRSRDENDTTLRQVNNTLRLLEEVTPAQHTDLNGMLTQMSTDIAKATEPMVKVCDTAFPGAKLPGPGGR